MNNISQSQGAGAGVSGITNPGIGNLNNNSGIGFFQQLIPSLIGLAFIVGAIVFFFMLILGAIQWITSGGDKNAVESARGRIGQALVGMVILLSVFVIVKLVETFFGINILVLDITPLLIK